ncbi:hypothetical protein M422DRAFT_275529 [Sphaerobolus stellatus SS14]|uniref:Unplaced genomic scaffold SPHSTscaffold_506, whole genome shotgun sequence n=1 Tax=Sphaerobolus stellatus (strain SS14) TaxID=990650 RepID=A0A0C9T4K8_SPHS4|nr:hypothetical protein M422DRAFT_275528 [Sphaerobolus stellatus SS14]KIJ23818.1 hypothetical protein M422DRAFT_275529 [Sphaerobolus stellatus SS14]
MKMLSECYTTKPHALYALPISTRIQSKARTYRKPHRHPPPFSSVFLPVHIGFQLHEWEALPTLRVKVGGDRPAPEGHSSSGVHPPSVAGRGALAEKKGLRDENSR